MFHDAGNILFLMILHQSYAEGDVGEEVTTLNINRDRGAPSQDPFLSRFRFKPEVGVA